MGLAAAESRDMLGDVAHSGRNNFGSGDVVRAVRNDVVDIRVLHQESLEPGPGPDSVDGGATGAGADEHMPAPDPFPAVFEGFPKRRAGRR